MKDRKDLMSISQFADLRGITAETLRHYDRIGLLSPAYIDPETNYRYYSILQYEQFGTILELRRLNFSLDEIKDFFSQRSVEHSLELLRKHRDELHIQLNELKKEEASLDDKIRYIRSIPPRSKAMTPEIMDIPERYYITDGSVVTDEEGMGFTYTALESRLQDEVSPILASDRMGLIAFTDDDGQLIENKWIPFIFVRKNSSKKKSRSFAAGHYASITSYEGWPEQNKPYEKLMEFIMEKELKVTGEPLVFFTVDITIAADEGEGITIQIPVEK